MNSCYPYKANEVRHILACYPLRNSRQSIPWNLTIMYRGIGGETAP